LSNIALLSAYARFGKAKINTQRSRSRGRFDESSGDELGETAVLYNVPHDPCRLPSLQGLDAIAAEDIVRPKSSKSTKIPEDDIGKVRLKESFASE